MPESLRHHHEAMIAAAPRLNLGYRKTRLEPAIYQRLLAHFQTNASRFRAEHSIDLISNDEPGIIPCLIFDDQEFNRQLALDLQPLLEAWAAMPLELSSCYGIRCYQRGTYLYNHVDRPTLVVSATICVDHALNSPWPLHIENYDGEASQVDLEPGECVLYEGMRLSHGRPYPLDGDYYAGIFVHFQPAGQSAETP